MSQAFMNYAVILLTLTGCSCATGSHPPSQDNMGDLQRDFSPSEELLAIDGWVATREIITTPEAFATITSFTLVTTQGDTLRLSMEDSDVVRCKTGASSNVVGFNNGSDITVYLDRHDGRVRKTEVDCDGVPYMQVNEKLRKKGQK